MILQRAKTAGRASWLSRWIGLLALGIVCILIAVLPVAHVAGVSLLGGLPVMMIYFWTMRLNSAMTPLTVFLMGLFHDLLVGAPVGFHALVYLLIYSMILIQRGSRMSWSFELTWLGFAVTAATAYGVIGVAGFAIIGSAPLLALIIESMLTITLYPLVGIVFDIFDRRVFLSNEPGAA